MRNSAKTALGGIVAALSLVIMLSSTVIPNMTYALPAIAGGILMLIVIEVNKRWAFCTYAAVSVLSLLILPDKETAMMYAAFFGYYPIVKAVFEKHLPRVLEYVCKFAVFNLSVVAAYVIIIFIFGIPIDEMQEYGAKAIPLLLLAANAVFILYDIVLSKFAQLYISKWRKHFRGLYK